MANNIEIGPQCARGLQTISFVNANLIAANVQEIIKVTSAGYLFYNPNNGSIAQFNGIELDEDYIINSKIVRDLSTIVYTGGNAVAPEPDNGILDENGSTIVDNDGNILV